MSRPTSLAISQNEKGKMEGRFKEIALADLIEMQAGALMTEQKRKYRTQEIGNFLSEI